MKKNLILKYFAQWKLIWFHIKIGRRKKNLPSHCGVISTNCFYSNQIKHFIEKGYYFFINFTKLLLPHPFGLWGNAIVTSLCYDVTLSGSHTVWTSHCLEQRAQMSYFMILVLKFGFKQHKAMKVSFHIIGFVGSISVIDFTPVWGVLYTCEGRLVDLYCDNHT